MEKSYRKARGQNMPYLLVFILLLCTKSVCAADWYVSTTGNDANSGSSASPKLTIQAAINAASSGDIIYINPGTYNEALIIAKSLTLQGVNSDKSQQKLDGTGLGTKSGIVLNAGITNVTIKNLTIQKFTGASGNSHAGIYAVDGNNNLTISNVALLDNSNASGFYANGPISGVSLTNSVVNNSGPGARGIVIWNGFKQNITISNNFLTNNSCCGIELQDGTASNVQINGNTIDISGGDNAIGVSGLNSLTGPNTINNNIITGGGRFGIEVKNPAGGVTVSGNNVSLTTQNSDQRDRAGIAVFRRGKMPENIDAPNGVTITGNTVTGYQQSSTSEGFGIVIEGTNHTVTGNTLTNNEVGILQQQNSSGYPNDADQTNVADQYFGRGNSPITCGNTIASNTFSGNTTDSRNVGGIGAGLVTNTNTVEYFCSIQPAINDADTQDGHTITVASGTYSEQVVVNKSLIVKGVGATKPVINFTGSVSGKPALFDVSKPNVTIENFDMKVDLTKLSSAIIASGTNISGVTVKDNNILATGSSGAGSFGTYTDRNAVSVNYGGTNNYRIASGGVNSISFTGNTVGGETDAFSMVRYFRSGISVDEGGGNFSGNTLQTINHDVLVRFGGNGAITISNNNFNGGGVELSDQNAAAGPVSVSSNTFNATFANTSAPGAAVLRVKNNYNGIVHTVSSNTFTNFNWAASVENMNNVTFNGNTFTGLNANSRSLVFNTKSISGNSNAITQVAVGMTATNNTFGGQGTALSFLNHDSDNDSYGTFTLGTAGNENTFAASLGTFVFLDGQSGTSNGSTFPTYPTTGQWPTTMECWGQNLNIVNNKFDIGSGLQLPLSMNLAQRNTLEGKLDHKPDVSCKGTLQFFLPVHNLTQNTYFSTIQSAISAANSGDVIECSEATYNEALIVDKSLTIQGISTDKSLQILDGTGLGTKSGIVLNNGVTNVTIKNFTIQKFTGSGGNSHAGIYGIGGNNNVTVTNVAILDNPSASGFYANGPISNVSITNSVVNNNGSGARGIVLWNGFKQNITISNNSLTNNNCCGIELQDGTASNVQINGNTIDISGGDNAIGVSGLNSLTGPNTINNNIITGGGRFGIEVKNPAGGVTVSGNNVSLTTQNSDLRDRAGIAVFRRGKMPENIDAPNGVTITGNTVTGYQQSSTSEGFGIVIEGTNHTVTGNTLTNNEVGILQQQNSSNYPNDADQTNVADQFFGRGNSPITCGNTIASNTFSGNTTDSRNVGGIGAGLVTNTNTVEYFCSIQPAIDDADTQNGHTITVAAGTYNENLNVTKSLTISGPNKTISPNNGSRVTEATITGGLNVDNANSKTIVIEGFQFQGVTSPLNYNGNTGNTVVLDITFRKNLINNNSGQLAIFTGSATNTANAIIQDNRFLSMSSNAMQLNLGSGGVTTAQITDNTINGAANAGMNLALTNSFINGNTISNTVQQGIQIADASGNLTVSNNVITNANTSADANRGGIRVRGTSFTGSVTIINNIISGSTNGICVPTGENITGKAISVSNNDLSGNTFGIKNSGTGLLSATCNWFGSTGATVPPLISGSVTFEPFLTNGTDNNAGAIGFQPVPNSCSGCQGGGVVTNTNTGENFCSIQAAINDADTQNGHTITVAAGTYKEDVSVTKQLTINGAGIDASIVEGPMGGVGATFQVAASGVVINGFTITRAGNNATDWNNNLNTAGVSVQGQTNSVELKNSKLVGNRTAIDINNSNGNNIHNNIITNNRTGAVFRNQTDNTLFNQNEVTDNWTVGIVFLDASSGTNSPVQSALNSSFSQNKITGNWYGGVVDRQTGGSLPAAGSNLKGFTCNWYGSGSPVISTANSSEPLYDAQIPVAFGGSATNPGGAPDIAGVASANIQYAPFLSTGTDNDGLTVGFQPVPGSCLPCVGTATIGTATTICEGGNATITVTGTPNTSVTYNINGTGSYTLALNGSGTGSFNTGALSSTTTYNLVSGINGTCTSALTGSVTITVNLNHSIALSSAVGTNSQASCIGTAIVPITYTLGGAASGATITGLPSGVSYAVNGNVLTISGVPTASGVFPYTIVTTGPCVTTSTTGTITVNVKPQVKIAVYGSEFVEGNNAILCDIDANASNNTLVSTVTTNCLAGPVLWRTKAGAGAWSEWTANAPTSQPSDNTEYQYQASCNACPSTIINAISIKINYRASVPQNVSMVADGTTILAGQSATVCDQDGNALVFNATCGAGEILLYSVDGGDYSTTIPTQMVDGNAHNYRVRCRKSDGTPSCVETESAAMTLKLTTISTTPTVSITPLNSCTTSSTFSGSSNCGSNITLWYNAATNQALPNLPTTPPTVTTSYYARCQNAEGCLSAPSNTVTYTVLPVNVAPVVTASANAVCTGSSVTLTTNCPSGASVLWNTSATDAVLTVAFSNVTTQSYSAQCIFANGCQTPFSEPKTVLWKAFDLTLINIGQSQSAVKPANDKALWTSQFITKDGGPDLEFSTQVNPTLFFSENVNKTAPRYWTIFADACVLGTNGSLTFDMLATPETGAPRSFNTHENNAPYFMYANREGWTELYAPNHPAYGFYQDNGAGGNVYDEGLPKGLYKLSVRYWDMKGWGSIYPATRKPQGNVLAYQEYWFSIQSKDGVGKGAARTATSGQPLAESDKLSNSFAQVMPNPVHKTLRLKVTQSKGETIKAELVDVTGRSILSRGFVAETNEHQEEFEVEKLVDGMYFLRVSTSNKEATLKVVKM